MTNQQIIFNESMELMKAGIIKTTGRTFEYTSEDGEQITVQEPEALHTFAMWKQLGRQVKRGEHAKAAFTIWKAGKGKAVQEEENAEADGEKADVKMFMKKAFFFTIDQTEPITAKA